MIVALCLGAAHPAAPPKPAVRDFYARGGTYCEQTPNDTARASDSGLSGYCQPVLRSEGLDAWMQTQRKMPPKPLQATSYPSSGLGVNLFAAKSPAKEAT